MNAEQWNEAAARHATTALDLYPEYPAQVQNEMFSVVVAAFKAGALAGIEACDKIARDKRAK